MIEFIEVRKIPEGHMPQNIGEISFNRDIPRSAKDMRDEWHVKLPCGHTIALREPAHQVFETDSKSAGSSANSGITVNPSIVCPNGDWHGFIVYNQMMPVHSLEAE
jgi:hypothetical protein